MEDGFLRLSRRFFSNEMWKEAREFSECEAWLDLIQSARFEATDKAYSELIGGREISYSRGQYPASISFLEKRWRWTNKKVRCFLSKLKKKGMITTCNNQGVNIISLCNYDQYNPVEPLSETPDRGEAKGKAKGEGPYVSINELQAFGARLMAEVRAGQEELAQKLENLGQAKGEKKKKEEEYTKERISKDIPKKGELSLPSLSENKIDFKALMGYYNSTFEGKLRPIRTMTDARKTAVKARVAQYGKDAVMEVFNLVLQSQFLLGANDRNWQADFDWIFKQANFTKILEGNYTGKGNKRATGMDVGVILTDNSQNKYENESSKWNR